MWKIQTIWESGCWGCQSLIKTGGEKDGATDWRFSTRKYGKMVKSEKTQYTILVVNSNGSGSPTEECNQTSGKEYFIAEY